MQLQLTTESFNCNVDFSGMPLISVYLETSRLIGNIFLYSDPSYTCLHVAVYCILTLVDKLCLQDMELTYLLYLCFHLFSNILSSKRNERPICIYRCQKF